MLKLVKRGPNVIHPEKQSAVGSRNSLNRGERNEYEESQLIIDEGVDKVLNHINSKLPPEVLEKLDIQGNIKEKLHNYFNLGMQNMLSRYITTVEDELGKKYRDLIDHEESRSIAAYSPRTIAEMIEAIAGSNKFNTSEIEQSIVNIYGHLQGSVQRGITDLEHHTNSLLRQKSDVGAMVRGENGYAVVKCSFKNSSSKPENVLDTILSVNILESEIISPVYHYQSPIQKLLSNLIVEYSHEMIDDEIERISQEILDKGEAELNSNEKIFEKIKLVDNYFSDDKDAENSSRYAFVAKRIMDCLEGVMGDIPVHEKDSLKLRDNVKRIIDDVNVKNRGFNSLVNSLTNILDSSKMGYQYIENFKNRRRCVIREYFTTNPAELPDENYSIQITYHDAEQIAEMRKAYQTQYNEMLKAIEETEDIVFRMLDKAKKTQGFKVYSDIEKEYLGSVESSSEEGEGQQANPKLWNELLFIKPKPSEVENNFGTFRYENQLIKKKIIRMNDLVALIFKKAFPEERLVIQSRIESLESKFNEYSSRINPFHIQPGVVLTINVTTVRRKASTIYSIANVLNEFLNMASKGFADKAFAQFTRRRSTTKLDVTGEFVSAGKVDKNDKVPATA